MTLPQLLDEALERGWIERERVDFRQRQFRRLPQERALDEIALNSGRGFDFDHRVHRFGAIVNRS